ncbi:MAG: penicillin-binding protein 1A, partial [Steroidobacteraceae bacterium]
FQYLAPDLPDASELRKVRVQLPLQVLARDGKLIAQIGEQRRIPVAWEEIPQVVVDAFLAAEDDRFFEHPGVDWQGLVRALVSNVSAGGVREGGGTITMQLARNTILTSERTLRRKLKEVFLALRLDREFSKQEVLTLYLNRIFLGQRAYGVGAAAEVYFDKRVADLTLPEAALLAGLPRAPSRDNPVASVDRAHERRAYVLRRMVETGKIDAAARDTAAAFPIESQIHAPTIEVHAPFVAEMVRLEMVRDHGDEALTGGFRVTTTIDSRLQGAANDAAWRTILEYDRRHGYRGPLEQLDAAQLADAVAVADAFARRPDRGSLRVAVVRSVGERSALLSGRDGVAFELDWEQMSWARPALPDDVLGPAPKLATDILAAGQVVFVEPVADGGWRLAQLPAVAGALVALDPRDGGIVALVGGFDFGASKYNRAVQAKRQPGSSFKPFLYSAALERGFTPATLVNDAPIVMQGGGSDGTEEWRPQNITKRFYGPTPMREGLVRSRNLVSIRLLRGVGIGPALKHIAAFGFGPEALPPNLTLALGTGQVTPIDMARGFAVFANGGFRVTPHVIASVTDWEGRVVHAAEPPLACPECVEAEGPVPMERRAPQAISPANAFVMTDMMTDVIQRGTAQRAKALGRRDLAGKTGTTNDRRDAWFVGYNADLVAASWIGFDQERSLGDNEEGGRTALPMWVYFMTEALRDRPEHRLPEPPGVVRMWVSRESGRPSRAGGGAVFEAFLERYAPQPGALEAADAADDDSVAPEPTGDSLF